ncbi:hypothetical protein K7432_004548 [Basidiobolus ranarum]|uniref:Protein phosphatase 1 regulatory subunit 21 N-terminal domain-containing protein n=1 Tax=Basidiobolus ranarum TaxID=34480 RepID=A0ABR2W5C8_9FUNG
MTDGPLSMNESVISSGEELSERYQKLFHEYSRIKAQHSVLKKAILKEQNQNVALAVDNKSKEQELRKILQQLDTLNFHNQRLTKRIEDLQKNGSPKLSGQWLLRASAKKELEKQRITLEATTLDLQSKIEENENLHKEIYEIHSLYTEQLNVYQKKVDELEKERNSLNEEINQSQMMNENSILALKSQKKDAELEIKKIKEDLDRTRENLTSVKEDIMRRSKMQIEQVVVVKQLIVTLNQYDQLYQQLFAHSPKPGYKAIFYQCSSLWTSLRDSSRLVQESLDPQNNMGSENSTFEEYLINEHLSVSHDDQKNSMDVFCTPANVLLAVQSVLSIYDKLLRVACENLIEATILDWQSGNFERISLKCTSDEFSELAREINSKVKAGAGTIAIEDEERVNLIRKLIAVRIDVEGYIKSIEQNPDEVKESPHYTLLKVLNENSEHLNGIVQSILLANFNPVETNGKNHTSSPSIGKGFEESFEECLSYHHILVSRLSVLQTEVSQLISISLDLHRKYDQLQQDSTIQRDKNIQLESEVNNLKSIIANYENPESPDQAVEPEEQIELVTVEASTQTTEVSQNDELQSAEEVVTNGAEEESVLSTDSKPKEIETGSTHTPSPERQIELPENLAESKVVNGSLPTMASNDLNPDQMSREDLIKRHYEGKLAQLLERTQYADSQALRMRKVCQDLAKKLEASESEKKTLLEELNQAKQQISRVQDELRTTEENYKSQLDMMTEHIAQLSANVENIPQ